VREGEDFVPSLDEKGIDVGSRAHISSSKYIATRPMNLIPEHAPYRTVPEKAEDRERPWFFIASLSGGAAPVSCRIRRRSSSIVRMTRYRPPPGSGDRSPRKTRPG